MKIQRAQIFPAETSFCAVVHHSLMDEVLFGPWAQGARARVCCFQEATRCTCRMATKRLSAAFIAFHTSAASLSHPQQQSVSGR